MFLFNSSDIFASLVESTNSMFPEIKYTASKSA